ncbi:MAG: type IV pilus assembly protein PilM [Actinobacteria bacterium]|nr:type IV pilus assembly protein PilM [Actinomycetota bacterium]
MAAPIGLDIGSNSVRAAQVSQGRKGAALERVGQVLLPTGAVREGEIVDPDVVVAALRDLWKSAKIKGRKVSVGLANQQVVVRRLDLPYMTESELRASLPLHVDGLIPLPVDEAVLDFCYLGEHESDDGERMVRIMVVAALRTMVDELLSVVRRAKLDPIGIDLDAFAALRSLTPADVLAERTTEMLVDVGATVTNLIAHQNGAPHFVRTVLFGGQNVTAMLADRLDLDLADAERLKLELAEDEPASSPPDDVSEADTDFHGWLSDDPGDQLTVDELNADSDGTSDDRTAGNAPREVQPGVDEATDVVRTQTRRLINEIKSSIDYCATQRDIPSIERVVLTGGASQWPGLASAMADQLGLDIATGSPLQTVGNGSGLSDDELAAAAPHLAVAVGLALGAQQ